MAVWLIVGKPSFQGQFETIIKYYKRAHAYSMDIMPQSASLIINPIMVYRCGFLFHCTTVG